MNDSVMQELAQYKLEDSFLLEEVYNAIDELPDKKRDIIYSFFGLKGYNKMSLRELAKKYNMSYQGISILLKRTFLLIKKQFICEQQVCKKSLKKQSFIDSIIESHQNKNR